MKTSLHFLFALILSGTISVFSQNPFTGKPMYKVSTTYGGLPLGSFTIELFPNIAPLHCRNFDSLVTAHFYDSTAFHRCIPGFVIQGGGYYSKYGGSISQWGQNHPSQALVPAEFSVAQHKRGRINAARLSTSINSATSQWCVMVADNFFLDGNYTVYGRVLKGMNMVDTIVAKPKMAPPPSTFSSMPAQKIEMFITYLGSNDTIPPKMQLIAPVNHTVGIDTMINLQLKCTAQSDGIIYQIQVSRDSTFNSDTLQFANSPNAYVYCPYRKGNTRYYWRARSNNGGHYSPWSDTWDFHTTGSTTGISKSTLKPDAVKIFPNPAQNQVLISGLQVGSTITLFNLKGELLGQEKAIAEDHQMRLEHISKGIYLLRVQSPNGKKKDFQLVKD